MHIERLKYLYQQYQSNSLTKADAQEWESAVGSQSMDEALLNLVDKDWNRTASDVPTISKEEKEVIYEYIVSQPQPRSVKIYRLWLRTVGIAATIAFIVSGIYFLNYKNNQTATSQTQNSAIIIKPGRNAATLTLANGKKIALSDAVNGELAKEAGVSITKTADGQVVYNIIGNAHPENAEINTLSTARGETYILTLPDKTMVWLNAASTIKYPANFTALKERKIELIGEAYFEVAKDKSHPFIVGTNNQTVEVLGTHFNVNAYRDEPGVATTLLEGSVNISSLIGKNQTKILKPGEQALNDGTGINIYTANVADATAWKDGDFQFNEEKLSSIVKKLERWYDVEIILTEKIGDKEFTGKIARSRYLSEVLRMMEKTNSAHFIIEGRRVTAIEK